jgi:hypothetical protein
MRYLALIAALTASAGASADWPYRIMKVECNADTIEVIDYSAYNEDGKMRLLESNVIDVDKLSTWITRNDLNFPDQPLPHKVVCELGRRKYQIVLTNGPTRGYSPPDPVVNITDITNPRSPDRLFVDFALARMPVGETKFVVSKREPRGVFIRDGHIFRDLTGGQLPEGASFDCRKARSEVEKLICASENLSMWDSLVAQAYGRALARAPRPPELRQDQRRWLQKRNECPDAICIEELQTRRYAELNGDPTAPVPPESADPCRYRRCPW